MKLLIALCILFPTLANAQLRVYGEDSDTDLSYDRHRALEIQEDQLAEIKKMRRLEEEEQMRQSVRDWDDYAERKQAKKDRTWQEIQRINDEASRRAQRGY